jgi:acyl-CoA thioesterase-2
MPKSLDNLLKLLNLEKIEENIFRGRSPKERRQRVFGGQVVGQALVAATHTVTDRVNHSIQAYFLRPGDPTVPILYEVDRIRDGKSFTTRRVVAIQHGRAIFSMGASFQKKERGEEHQVEMPDTPMPEELPPEEEYLAKMRKTAPRDFQRWYREERPFEFRALEPINWFRPRPRPPEQRIWFRTRGKLGDDPVLHQCLLAYMSDMTLMDTCMLPHAYTYYDENLQAASLDHTMWFHRPFRVDEWLLYVQDSPSSGGNRGINRGLIYAHGGTLVATVVQEGLVRKTGP